MAGPTEDEMTENNTSEIGLDPTTFEVLRSSYANLVDRMGQQLQRTCHSFVIYNRDFANALHDGNGDTIAQGPKDLQAHVGTMHHTCKNAMDSFDEINPGDVLMTNDVYQGGSHFPDVRILRPIFYDGEIIAVANSSAHWADVGGPVPGSINVEAEEFYAEGVRITPIKIWKEGEFQENIAEMLTSNMRVSEDRIGDLRAQAVATQLAEDRLLELVEKYGIETIKTSFEEMKDYVERMTRSRLRDLPDGTWHAEDYLDSDFSSQGEGMVKVDVKMTIDDDELYFDLTGSDPYVNSCVNAGYGITFSGIICPTKSFFPDIPLNFGLYRLIDVELPEDSVVNPPEPVACSSGGHGAFEKVVNCIFDIRSQVMPELGMACSFNLEYLLTGGTDARAHNQGDEFMLYDWMAGGWGGRNGKDGLTATAPVYGPWLSLQSCEVQEWEAPVQTTEHSIKTDSAGPGKWRGGLGTEKGGILTDLESAVVSYACDRGRSVPWGLFGGLPSLPHGLVLNPQTPDEEYLGTDFANYLIEEGDEFTRPAAGGGGYGDPLERDPDAVLEDVIDEYVSIERAKKDYGVIVKEIDPDLCEYEIEYEATENERDWIRERRKDWLDTDPETVSKKYKGGEISQLDVIRRFGVILDWDTGEVLTKTTRQYRNMLQDRAVAHWGSV